jgi:hypothetical protein
MRVIFVFIVPLSKQALNGNPENKKPPRRSRRGGLLWLCGERGIRTPGTLLRYTRFPGVPIKPLLHLSLRPPKLSLTDEALVKSAAKEENKSSTLLKNSGANYENIFTN